MVHGYTVSAGKVGGKAEYRHRTYSSIYCILCSICTIQIGRQTCQA